MKAEKPMISISVDKLTIHVSLLDPESEDQGKGASYQQAALMFYEQVSR